MNRQIDWITTHAEITVAKWWIKVVIELIIKENIYRQINRGVLKQRNRY